MLCLVSPGVNIFHGSRLSAESLQPLPLSTTIFALNVCVFPRQFLFMFFSSSHEKDSCHIRVRPTACQHLNESSLRQSGFHSEVLGFRILISFFWGEHIYKQKMFFLPLRNKHWLALIKEKLPLSIFPAFSSVFNNMCIVMHF